MRTVASEILQSFTSIGFVCLINHGLDHAKVEEMFDWSRRFFDLPLDHKQLAPHPKSGTHHRGYSAPGVERVSQHIYSQEELENFRKAGQDVKESFEAGREDDPLMPNIWLPEDVLPGFKEACLKFYWDCYELEIRFLRALATGLSLPDTYFLDFHQIADNQLRLLHYPPVADEHLSNNTFSRIGAHSDFGTVTVGGLEVQDPQDHSRFLPIPVIPGAVIVNAGDFMARWSNDVIKSTVHRVRSPPNQVGEDGIAPPRYSIPYDLSTIVDAIPGTWDEGNPKKYEPISAKEYVLKRLAALY
ncbi:thymine dioxygenase [Coprinopsis marcescibilis]|uniref:Thymine dioxygenase n=1 Tax=Coprinopsis marcescibilis TaxID=230819 RepID=A0A5C3KUJ9_COPMA|nr:thymine dioxygenase [Coprinopsis marcescibilis]